MARKPTRERDFDRELADLPESLRWREWLRRVEAVLFASAEPVPRCKLATLVGEQVALDILMSDLASELADRAYELRRIGDGWMMTTRPAYASAIRAVSKLPRSGSPEFREIDLAVLAGIAREQPVTRRTLAKSFGREINPEIFARLRAHGLIADGPRSPQPGAPRSFVTTETFLVAFGLSDLDALNEIDGIGS